MDNFSLENMLTIVGPYGLRIVGSLLIFFIGKKLSEVVTKILTSFIKKSSNDKTIIAFISSAIYCILLLLVILAALSNLGIQTTMFIAVLSAMGLAIGLSLKDTLSSIGAGFLIILFTPFKADDTIEVVGVFGVVESINIFSTILRTDDNKKIIIPNSKIISDKIINYSAKKVRRVDLVFSISYDDDLKKAKEILLQIVTQNDLILKSPEPLIAVLALTKNSVDFTVRVWVKTENYFKVSFEINESVKLEFDKNSITIPYPQLEITQKIK